MRGVVLVIALLCAMPVGAQPATPCAANQGVWVITTTSATLWVCASDGLSWVVPASPWGGITGTMSAQADLQAALDAKGTSNFNGVYSSLTSIPATFAPIIGAGAGDAVAGNDTRLTNARTPTAHASSHVTGGSDVVANAVAAGNAGLLTGADKTKLDAQSGTNTGDQTITLTGNVTGTGTGSFAATIANDAVTYAKIQNVSATDKVLGRSTAGAGDVEEIVMTAAGRALIDDADAAAQRTTLTLGNVENTSDANKPVSTATQTALNLKANLASPTFTGTVVVPASTAFTTPVIGAATGTSLATTGTITSSGGAVGYAVGAGGTVTQLTSKATGATLSKLCGDITMNAAALAAAAIVSFTLTNTTIAAADLLVLNHVTTGTRGGYGLNAQAAAGSAIIYVRNNTAGSLSEAIVVRFCVVKGALS